MCCEQAQLLELRSENYQLHDKCKLQEKGIFIPNNFIEEVYVWLFLYFYPFISGMHH